MTAVAYVESKHPRAHDGKWTRGATGVVSKIKAAAETAGRATAPKGDRGKGKATPSAKGMSAADSKGFVDDHYGDWRENLTPAQEKGLRFYQSPGFALMNGQLRGLDTGGLKRQEHASDADLTRAKGASRALHSAIKAAPPLKDDLTVFRGFSTDQFGKLEPGKILQDKGFTSTALTNDAGAVGKAARKATAEVKLPAGTKAAAGSTRELVLPPNSKFRVVSVTSEGGNPHVVMEYVLP